MLCQNCNKNEADNTFIVNWMGTQYQMHICRDCLEQMWQYAGAMGQRDTFRAFTGWWPDKANPRALGESPFPRDAGEQMKRRLRLVALHARLKEAAMQEKYEEAAKLRDSIASIEQEAYLHES
ncbi:MAG: UvrB/UvrC motif-containing protein [Oscillospiraceae bacterium]|jgi:protein-arginine kinase activator protein McsA|nr:UvrB/UvrC motif-containing protein [Oscillospiraceae bacterium]